ncbi:MAG: pseudouridine synthase [Sulfuriflexus sp.]|nr:pseudouridine synthase [Sulfuriflexus sp.]MDT8405255.1 pseudouridine synthase [Sulfuriflexus sp.]
MCLFMLPYNPPPHNRLDILYQDAFLLVINKPAGVLSVPGRGPDKQDCMISRVQASYPDALIVHRLDMATSGILVLALDADTHRQLSRQFQQREVSKQYIAVVTGRPTPTAGLIDKPMICDWPNRPRQIIDYEQGKPAQTRYETLEYMPASDTSRVLLSPVTGRTHQLRLHMQSIGHAILGDGLYASPAVIAAAERLLLHASSLSFPHPANGARIVIESAVPF